MITNDKGTTQLSHWDQEKEVETINHFINEIDNMAKSLNTMSYAIFDDVSHPHKYSVINRILSVRKTLYDSKEILEDMIKKYNDSN